MNTSKHIKTLQTLMNNYEIISSINSSVFSAVHKQTQTKVALKFINKNSNNKNLIKNEIINHKMASNHKNILKLLGVFETTENVILVTEFIAFTNTSICYNDGNNNTSNINSINNHITNTNTDDSISTTTINNTNNNTINTTNTNTNTTNTTNTTTNNNTNNYNITQIKSLSNQLINALLFLHQNNIIHGDLKNDNLLIYYKNNKTNDLLVKICDFGFSLIKSDKKLQIKGTPTHMAPELLSSINNSSNSLLSFDHLIDIWALGITLFEIIINKTPFYNSTTIYELVDDILNNQIDFELINEYFIIKQETNKTEINLLIDFIKGLLQKDVKKRSNWPELSVHPFITENNNKKTTDYIQEEDYKSQIDIEYEQLIKTKSTKLRNIDSAVILKNYSDIYQENDFDVYIENDLETNKENDFEIKNQNDSKIKTKNTLNHYKKLPKIIKSSTIGNINNLTKSNIYNGIIQRNKSETSLDTISSSNNWQNIPNQFHEEFPINQPKSNFITLENKVHWELLSSLDLITDIPIELLPLVCESVSSISAFRTDFSNDDIPGKLIIIALKNVFLKLYSNKEKFTSVQILNFAKRICGWVCYSFKYGISNGFGDCCSWEASIDNDGSVCCGGTLNSLLELMNIIATFSEGISKLQIEIGQTFLPLVPKLFALSTASNPNRHFKSLVDTICIQKPISIIIELINVNSSSSNIWSDIYELEILKFILKKSPINQEMILVGLLKIDVVSEPFNFFINELENNSAIIEIILKKLLLSNNDINADSKCLMLSNLVKYSKKDFTMSKLHEKKYFDALVILCDTLDTSKGCFANVFEFFKIIILFPNKEIITQSRMISQLQPMMAKWVKSVLGRNEVIQKQNFFSDFFEFLSSFPLEIISENMQNFDMDVIPCLQLLNNRVLISLMSIYNKLFLSDSIEFVKQIISKNYNGVFLNCCLKFLIHDNDSINFEEWDLKDIGNLLKFIRVNGILNEDMYKAYIKSFFKNDIDKIKCKGLISIGKLLRRDMNSEVYKTIVCDEIVLISDFLDVENAKDNKQFIDYIGILLIDIFYGISQLDSQQIYVLVVRVLRIVIYEWKNKDLILAFVTGNLSSLNNQKNNDNKCNQVGTEMRKLMLTNKPWEQCSIMFWKKLIQLVSDNETKNMYKSITRLIFVIINTIYDQSLIELDTKFRIQKYFKTVIVQQFNYILMFLNNDDVDVVNEALTIIKNCINSGFVDDCKFFIIDDINGYKEVTTEIKENSENTQNFFNIISWFLMDPCTRSYTMQVVEGLLKRCLISSNNIRSNEYKNWIVSELKRKDYFDLIKKDI